MNALLRYVMLIGISLVFVLGQPDRSAAAPRRADLPVVTASGRPGTVCLAPDQPRTSTLAFTESAGVAGTIASRAERFTTLSGQPLGTPGDIVAALIVIQASSTITWQTDLIVPGAVAAQVQAQNQSSLHYISDFYGQSTSGAPFTTTVTLRLELTRNGQCQLLLPLLAAPAARTWQPQTPPLSTPWTALVSPASVQQDYPRPQMVRPRWHSLNGEWQFASGALYAQPPFQQTLPDLILVPFPVESALSGIMRAESSMWYRRTFVIPAEWAGQRVRLNFDAVDWEATVYVNGQLVGSHRGGYDAFSFDITDRLQSGVNELIVKVRDFTDSANQPLGKQTRQPRVIWYTAVSGIWQSVWLEPVPAAHITSFRLTPQLTQQQVQLTVQATALPGDVIEALVYDQGTPVGSSMGSVGSAFGVPVPNPHPWSPADPFLYDVVIRLRRGSETVDEVHSYVGMRSIGVATINGFLRPTLNGQYLYQLGVLDQGYWPDGLYTAPTDAALRFDIEQAKALGYNVIRKHVKVEPARWYYWADKLGVLVWQDMPSMRQDVAPTAADQAQFKIELQEMVTERANSPAIAMWVIFNEGWGQHTTNALTNFVRGLDGSRLINSASGWDDLLVGDVVDWHSYVEPARPPAEPDRIAVAGEYGGVGLIVDGHRWGDKAYAAEFQATGAQLTNRYVGLITLLRTVHAPNGLSGSIYTQLYDVENELNGLWTYDRVVLKADGVAIRNAHLSLIGGR